MKDNGLHILESIGSSTIAVDKATHEIVIMIKTDIGMLTQHMSQERATQLGIELIRAGGRHYNFTADLIAEIADKVSKEKTHEGIDPDIDIGHNTPAWTRDDREGREREGGEERKGNETGECEDSSGGGDQGRTGEKLVVHGIGHLPADHDGPQSEQGAVKGGPMEVRDLTRPIADSSVDSGISRRS